MLKEEIIESSTDLMPPGDTEAIRHLKEAIASGSHWYIALLEAIKLWTSVEEVYNNRKYRYLIAGEAFDWLLLAERLCNTVDGLLPADEAQDLLFHNRPPLNLDEEEFKSLIGTIKYHQYLNYFYSVTVEEALVLAIQDEVRKEWRISGYYKDQDYTDEVYRRIYGTVKITLLKSFRREKGYQRLQSISLSELKEFTCWLFNYRIRQCDRSKVASDTKKALDWLAQQRTNNSRPISDY